MSVVKTTISMTNENLTEACIDWAKSKGCVADGDMCVVTCEAKPQMVGYGDQERTEYVVHINVQITKNL